MDAEGGGYCGSGIPIAEVFHGIGDKGLGYTTVVNVQTP
jgi:hypothetical protein